MEWISVKDRLPETDKEVLLYHINDCFVIGCIKSYGLDDLLWWFWWEGHRYTSSTNSKHITHWMPLPEPPKQRKSVFSYETVEDGYVIYWHDKKLEAHELADKLNDTNPFGFLMFLMGLQ